MTPRISVVIPTHDRCARLLETLASLTGQDAAPSLFEVIVVADGCRDESARRVRELDSPYPLTLLEQPALGPAAARNRGAAAAAAPLLLFLDDDMTAAPGLVAAHLAAQEAHPEGVVLGYFPMPAASHRPDPFHVALKLRWDQRFAALAEPGHRYSFLDLCAGNLSLSRRLFDDVGGFDPGFERGSGGDHDLGMRLLRHGAAFRFSRAAFSAHHAIASPSAALHRARQDGHCEVLLAHRYPALFAVLRLRRLGEFGTHRRYRALWRLAWWQPALAAMAAWWLRAAFSLCRAGRLTYLGGRIFSCLDGYHFWRGVRAAVGSRQGWEKLVRAAETPPAIRQIEIDLAVDGGRLEEILGQSRPDAVRLRFGEQFLGDIPAVPGSEPIRAEHVRAELIHRHALPLLGLLVLDALGVPTSPNGSGVGSEPRRLPLSPRGGRGAGA